MGRRQDRTFAVVAIAHAERGSIASIGPTGVVTVGIEQVQGDAQETPVPGAEDRELFGIGKMMGAGRRRRPPGSSAESALR